MGLAVVSSSAPESLIKELLAIVAGVCVFLVVCWSLRDLERAKTVRYLAAVAGIGLLAFNLLFGVEKFGARNWIQLGGVSFQPSEFVKVCFIYVGASTLSRLMAKRNIVLFIAYSAVICACLALMKDFRHRDHFLCRVPCHRVPALRQLCDDRTGHRRDGLRGRSGAALSALRAQPV